MRLGNVILNVVSFILVGAGLALIASFFVGPGFLNSGVAAGTKVAKSESFDVPVLAEKPAKPDALVPEAPKKTARHKVDEGVDVPEDKTLRMTVPKMSRVQNAEIPTTVGTDEEALRNNVAIHLKGTGFPWEKGSNVYIAGHRLGYLNSGSFLAFYDLNKLEKGDEIFLTDARGREYRYVVFRTFVVDPTDIQITRPVPGKSVVTLQTCTLPDYSKRLIVQAERVS